MSLPSAQSKHYNYSHTWSTVELKLCSTNGITDPASRSSHAEINNSKIYDDQQTSSRVISALNTGPTITSGDVALQTIQVTVHDGGDFCGMSGRTSNSQPYIIPHFIQK